MNQLNNANVLTPTPGNDWIQFSDTERLACIKEALIGLTAITDDAINVVETKSDGQVIMRLLKPLPPTERGTFLLDVEDHLKETVDAALVVWLEPLGDKSSLRNLRGIEVKS